MRTEIQIKAWLQTISDRMLRKLIAWVHAEGVRRGFGEFWSE
jgi:hypothetical protein